MPAAKRTKSKRGRPLSRPTQPILPRVSSTSAAAVIARMSGFEKGFAKGPGSGMRMLTFYINRAGHNLSASRKAELAEGKDAVVQEN